MRWIDQHEKFGISIRWKVDKYLEGHKKPYETVDLGFNEMTTAGIQNILNVLIGSGTAVSSANAYLGVGSGTTAFTLADTDLSASLGSNFTITAGTAASPIVLTTSTAHGFSNGDYISVSGVTGLVGANGTWVAASASGTTVSLTGTTGTGTYTSSGVVAKGNRFRKPMNATYPSRASQTLTFVSTFQAAEANYSWSEWGLFWGSVGANMISRRVPGSPFGTKVNGNVWVLTATLTLS